MTSPDVRTEQLPTGIEGLDRLLRGGIRRAGLHVILGRPGAGKSVLAHQLGAHHIRTGGTVLYLTALVETHQTLISQARSFRFFDPGMVAHGFYYASLYPALERGGLAAMGEEIKRLVRERSPSLLILDGLHALKLTASSHLDYQRWLHELEAQAAVTGMTTLLLTHPRKGASEDPTFTVADGIIAIRTRAINLRSVRLISVVKLRGVDHIRGWHTAEITIDGLTVYPRLEALVAAEGVPSRVPPVTRHTLDVDGLEKMMGGGLPSSTVTFLLGTPGSGKTLLALAFLSAGARQKEKSLYFGFHETPDRLLDKAEQVGLPLRKAVERGLVQLHWRPPSELLSDALAAKILSLVDEHEIRRLVIDGHDQFRRSAVTGGRELDFLAAFCNLLRTRGVTTIMTQDMPRVAGESFDIPFGETSSVLDNIVHVRSTELHAEFRWLIAIIKMRTQGYDRSIRELIIGDEGLRVGDVLEDWEALLTGLPRVRDARSAGSRKR
jgi:circadian clock protein KaiC